MRKPKHVSSEQPDSPSDDRWPDNCQPNGQQTMNAQVSFASPADRLDLMFANQFDLMTRFPEFRRLVDFNRLVLPEIDQMALTNQIDIIATCITQEASELRDWVPWKHWSRRLGNKREDVSLWTPEHIEELRVEVIDLLHFVLEAAIVLGMGTKELFELWQKKANINVDRQVKGDY